MFNSNEHVLETEDFGEFRRSLNPERAVGRG